MKAIRDGVTIEATPLEAWRRGRPSRACRASSLEGS
jgi:hypothetical protein